MKRKIPIEIVCEMLDVNCITESETYHELNVNNPTHLSQKQVMRLAMGLRTEPALRFLDKAENILIEHELFSFNQDVSICEFSTFTETYRAFFGKTTDNMILEIHQVVQKEFRRPGYSQYIHFLRNGDLYLVDKYPIRFQTAFADFLIERLVKKEIEKDTTKCM